MASTEDSSSGLDSTEGISAYFVLFSTLLALVLILSKLLHDNPFVNRFFPEAGMILVVGMVAGFFVSLFVETEVVQPEANNDNDDGSDSVARSLLSFSPQVFFVALLPPIIFNSGYHLRRELFFRHILPISIFAVIGTLVSAVTITFVLELVKGLGWTGDFTPTFTELLAFGALISATDPVSTLAVFQAKRVDPHLFYLVFGESVLNDAVGLVLFDAFSRFVVKDNGAGKVVIGMGEFIFDFLFDSVGSPVLGLLCGIFAALLFKHIDMRDSRLLELSVYILIMYVPFLMADCMNLSGIVTILFTGMTARAYVVPNLSQATADSAEILFRLFAHLAETSIFLELGLSVFGLRGSLNGLFILWALLACLIGRVMNVYPIAFFYNLRLQTDPKNDSELANERRQKRKDHISTNVSHVEMTDSLPTADHHRQHPEDIQTNIALMRQHSTATNLSVQTATPRVRRDLKISCKTAHMLCFSGLRGAVAYACVRSFPDTFGRQTEFVVTTMVIVLVTVFFLGGTTGAMLSLLDIPMDVDEDVYMENWHEERRSANFLLKIEDIIQRNVVRQESPVHMMAPTTSLSPQPRNRGTSPVGTPPPTSMDFSNVEITEDSHFQTLGEVPSSPRRRSSLFDFGFKD